MQLAFLLFNVAEPAMWVAILVYAFDLGGTTEVGLVSIVLLLPAGVLAPVAASLGDRYRRERVVRFGYLAQAATTGVTAVALLADAPKAVVYALAAVAAVTYTMGRPNHHALMPSLADTPEEVAAANSVSSLTEGIGATIGGIVAASLAGVGAGAVYAVAAAALALAVVLTLGVHGPDAGRSAASLRPWTLATDAAAGLATLARSRGPRLLVVIAAAVAVATGAIGVLLVPLAIDTLGLGDPGVGLLSTVLSVGLFVGAGVSVAFATRPRLALAMLLSATAFALSGVALGGASTTALAIAASIIFGAAITLLDVLGRTMLQRTTTDDVLTRVFGAVEALWLLGYAAGAAVAPAIERATGLHWAFVISGVVVLLVTLAAFPALRGIDASSLMPERQLALLARIPMFAPLPRLDLERLARQLDPIDTPAGTEVIRQGDMGDRFYVIDAGDFGIEVDGQHVATLGEGDFFGEIALLHDVPRTATVRALVEGAVWALDQEEFLATLTGLPQAATEAHRISAERLRTA
jgi:MFS family permease